MDDREVVLVTGIYAVVVCLIAAFILMGEGAQGRNEAGRDGGVSHGMPQVSPEGQGNA